MANRSDHLVSSGLQGQAEREAIAVVAAGPLAETAISGLRHAIAAGFRNPDAYHNDDALDPIGARDDFRILLPDLDLTA